MHKNYLRYIHDEVNDNAVEFRIPNNKIWHQEQETMPTVCGICGRSGHFTSRCWFRKDNKPMGKNESIDNSKVIRSLENRESTVEPGNL